MPSDRAHDRRSIEADFSLPQRAAVAPMVVVRFLNPTLNKALHVGHLRNACLGSAAASCLRHLGVRVIRHCILEDVGPHMALAIHGFERAFVRRKRLFGDSEKPDHQAHAYYLYGRRLCTPRRNRSGASRPRRATTSVQISQAIVPDEVLRDWALGRTDTSARAEQIKSLALRGQSETLQSFGIGFDCRDFESAETPYVAGFLDHGLARDVFRRKDDESIVYAARGPKILLKYGPYALHESAHLLCFMYRSLVWRRPGWIHLAFAGQEWAPTMRRYPALLKDMGVADAPNNYIMVFHGMVTSRGQKVASQLGRTLLADDLLAQLENLSDTSKLVRRSAGHMTSREIACLLARISLLEVGRGQDVEFSIRRLAGRTDSPAWQILIALASVCAMTNSAWAVVQPLPKKVAHYRHARELCRTAVERLSFDGIVAALHGISSQIASASSAKGASRANIGEMLLYLRMLGLGEREGGTQIAKLPSLFELERPQP